MQNGVKKKIGDYDYTPIVETDGFVEETNEDIIIAIYQLPKIGQKPSAEEREKVQSTFLNKPYKNWIDIK